MGIPTKAGSEKQVFMDSRKRTYPHEGIDPMGGTKMAKTGFSHLSSTSSVSQSQSLGAQNAVCPSLPMDFRTETSHATSNGSNSNQNLAWGQFTSRENFALLHLV